MRILFVAIPGSIHSARWINTASSQEDWDAQVYPAVDGDLHPYFRNITLYGPSRWRPKGLDPSVRLKGLWPLPKGSGKVRAVGRRLFPPLADPGRWLAWVIRYCKPDMVHSLEFQSCSYLTIKAKKRLGEQMPPWIVTNWGCDVHLFGRLSYHRDKVREVLETCDYYTCECERDIQLARDYGLRGRVLPVVPNTGGFDLERIAPFRQPGPTSDRKLIIIKGYQHFAGRSLVALRALEKCADLLKGYRVAIYLANPDVELAAELLSQDLGIPVECVPYCGHDEMLQRYGQARVYIGLSITDAISTSLLESMVMGAFPIQSCTACADEWIVNGQSGYIVPPMDAEVVAEALRRALTDDRLVDRAAELNAQTARERLDQRLIQPKVAAMYEQVYAETKGWRERLGSR